MELPFHKGRKRGLKSPLNLLTWPDLIAQQLGPSMSVLTINPAMSCRLVTLVLLDFWTFYGR